MINKIGYTPNVRPSFAAKLNLSGNTEGLSKKEKALLKEDAKAIGTKDDTIDIFIAMPASSNSGKTELAYSAKINGQMASNYLENGDSFDYVAAQLALDEIAEKERRGEFL